MNENINLVEILKNCPKGTELYSPLFGEVVFDKIDNREIYPIAIISNRCGIERFSTEGKYYAAYDKSECMLFPSKDQRDWSKFKCPKPKFDPNTLKPFDKILVRDNSSTIWTCSMFFSLYT